MLLCRYYSFEIELVDCIRLLIQRGIDSNKKSGKSGNGETALFILSNHIRPSKYLIDVVRLLVNQESDMEDATNSTQILRDRGFIQEADILLDLIQSYRLGLGSVPNEVQF
jgi:hypothetical protein